MEKRHLITPVNNGLYVLFVVNLLLAVATEETLLGLALSAMFLGFDYVIYKVLRRFE